MAYYREGGTTPHLRLAKLSVGFQSTMNNSIAKQNGGGAEWVDIFIRLHVTKVMGEPMYGLFLSLHLGKAC